MYVPRDHTTAVANNVKRKVRPWMKNRIGMHDNIEEGLSHAGYHM